MYKHCLFLLLSIPFAAQAQTKTQSLLEEYARLDSMGVAAQRVDNIPLVIDLNQKMMEIGKQVQNDSLVMRSQFVMAQALAFYGIFDVALRHYHEVLSMAEQSNNCYYKVKTAQLIGSLHQNLKDWNRSQQFLKKALNHAISCDMFRDTFLINIDEARNRLHLEGAAEGIHLLEQNLAEARRTGNMEAVFFGINNLSNLLAEAGQFDKAMTVGLEAFQLPEEFLGDLEKAQIYQRLAQIAVGLNDLKNAQFYAKEGFKYARNSHQNEMLLECYRVQADIDNLQHNYKDAVKNLVLYSDLKDTLYQQEYDAKTSVMIALYDLESKQKTIALLEKDQEIKTAQLQQQRIWMFAGLLSLLAVIFFIRFRNQRKVNQIREAFGQDLLQAQEQERQRISRELHDSVGQNILFIKNRLQRLTPAPEPAMLLSVDAALEEVRNIAKDLYPNQLEQYGLSAAVENLCETARESSGIFISSDLQGIDEKLNREAQINCYRIIQECLNNAMKHAQASSIRITSRFYPGKIELTVQDNGKGFDKATLEYKSVRSFGMINMEERIKMLRGNLDLESTANKGAKLTFSIPV
jgi:signal transduction histidine kinase